jgi:hypothetical protein
MDSRLNKIRLLMKAIEVEDLKIEKIRANINNSEYVYRVRRDKLQKELEGLENCRDSNNLFCCLTHTDRSATAITCPCFHGHCAECEDQASRSRNTKLNDQNAIGKCKVCSRAVHGWFYNETNYAECTKCSDKWCHASHPAFKQAPRYTQSHNNQCVSLIPKPQAVGPKSPINPFQPEH